MMNRQVISRTLKALLGDFSASYGDTYESIVILSGQTKPDEDTFTSKYNELNANHGFIALRDERNRLLAESDYLALSDVTMSDEMKTYRQALRDLPANTSDPANPTWPTKPGG